MKSSALYSSVDNSSLQVGGVHTKDTVIQSRTGV